MNTNEITVTLTQADLRKLRNAAAHLKSIQAHLATLKNQAPTFNQSFGDAVETAWILKKFNAKIEAEGIVHSERERLGDNYITDEDGVEHYIGFKKA